MMSKFENRHIGPNEADIERMLAVVGESSLDTLIDKVVPPQIRRDEPMRLPAALSEPEALQAAWNLAEQNIVKTSLIGMGYHGTITPPVVQRKVLENPAWYTAYTPYQPEISQGRLEALLNYQTVISDLTGMEIANASLLDEATAVAEAVMMAARVQKKGDKVLLAPDCHPQTKAILHTRFDHSDIEVVDGYADKSDLKDFFCMIVQYPGSCGEIRDLHAEISAAKEAGLMVIVSADILALALLEAPGTMGADIVVGSSQRFGVPMGFGGPHAAYFATRNKYQRSMPGRLVGVSIDKTGKPALRLALQTREQHIRRDKATSNICTAQVLLAIIAGFYAVYHGPEGLRAIAEEVHNKTARLAAWLKKAGFKLRHSIFFDTLTIESGAATPALLKTLDRAGFLARDLGNALGITLDESITEPRLARLAETMGLDIDKMPGQSHIPSALIRSTTYLTHSVFHSYRSETQMLRYMRQLSDKDLALDRSMIPLGSCTMKLNATSEMAPVTWRRMANVHPFAPEDKAQGYIKMIRQLEEWLCQCTGYAAVSIQPNAGSQGEFAGLLAIKRYHHACGQEQRNICLIPASAHGTNPASAVMAGLKVVVVACDKEGNVDLEDLRAKADKHSDNLAALMITYPSTHGVFEEAIVEICDLIHAHGGQVYVDGANLNALVGLSSLPGFGADVSHLNLHKTFCIPHGGGGPGVGPVGVAEHLVPYLPGHPLKMGDGAVSAAPYGSASILPITWMYIAMMGPDGLEKATKVAIVSANYIAARLSAYYPVLYTGKHGYVAHECILDIREIKEKTGISNEDIAKRLMDYGFHAPTMSFPVPGTLMVEPTESEDLGEIDRFIDAMIAIKREIDKVASGEWPLEDNPLVNAPHIASEVTKDIWEHPYSRQVAAYPDGNSSSKYWPPVARIDNVYGDRHLVCSCLPLDAYND